MTQDSFKYVRSLKFLDLSSTNLFDLDGCIFIQLTSLHTLKIERVTINCSSCWLPVAKKNSIQLFGQCLSNMSMQRLDALTNQQLHNACSKSSIDCSSNSCEVNSEQKSFLSDDSPTMAASSHGKKRRSLQIVLVTLFGVVALLVVIMVMLLVYRWRNGQRLLCCDALRARAREARRQQKQIIDRNPAVIESVVTHGANMNVPSNLHQNYAYANENTASTKRKLFNPMFDDSPRADHRHSQNETSFRHHHSTSASR